jgi:ribonuclease E
VIAGDSGEGDDLGDPNNPRRRRRRRGGRKRRRDGGPEDGLEDGEEVDEDDDAEDDPGEAEDTGGEPTEEAAKHRRRRRRRRGEETDGPADGDTEVVVKVREPRAATNNRSKDTAVTGIDGSTRLEAKKLRRREGRAASRRRAPILSEAEFLARRESVQRKMLIRQREDYSQIAVIEDGVLVEHYVDRASAASLIGNIYLGKVQNVLPGMEAAFIDIGRGRNAVLYAGEVDWDSAGEQGQNRKIEDVFTAGQLTVVQVSKDPVGAKGARLTSHVSIPGRYVVYAPKGHISGISRKLSDHERGRLKSILDSLVDASASVVIRTAAEGASEDELVRDVSRLKAQWEVIEKKTASKQAPQLLYAEPDLTMRIVRDLFTEDFSSLIVDGHGGIDDAFDTVGAYAKHVAPHLVERIERWDRNSQGDLFAQYRIDEQIAKALDRKVHLPSGGSLVIDRTEAMTVVDVNTGRFTGSGGNLEATVTSNNLEAAEEIVRQLRLRDIGGIIIIDFIDMVLPSNRELLLRRLVECLGRDRTRHQVSEVTSLGLVQLTRKKVGTGLSEAFTKGCETCDGLGQLRFEEPVETQVAADGGERHTPRRSRRRG